MRELRIGIPGERTPPASPKREGSDQAARIVFLSASYLALAATSEALRLPPDGRPAMWLPSGALMLALLVADRREWPLAVLSCAFADLGFRLLRGAAPEQAALLCLARVVESVSGAAVFRLTMKRKPGFVSQREFIFVAALTMGLAVPLGATIGAAGSAGFGDPAYWKAWAALWAADTIGALLTGPLVVAFFAGPEEGIPRPRPTRALKVEWAILALIFALVALAFYADWLSGFPYREFLIIPIIVWSAQRFGTRGSGLANLGCAVLLAADASGFWGLAPGPRSATAPSPLDLQVYICLTAMIGALIGEGSERWRRDAARIAAGERRYREIFDNAPLGIIHTTCEGRLVSANRKLAALFGYASVEDLEQAMEGRLVQDLLYADPEERDRKLPDILGSPAAWVVLENRYRRKDGSGFVGRAFFRRLETPAGEARIEGMIEDRSALYATEERLKAALAEKDVLLAEKDTLLAELEHRVKNNLNVVASLISLGATELEEGKSKKILVEAQTRIRSMSLIYEQLYKDRASGKVALGDYLEELARSLVETYALAPGKVELALAIDDWDLDTKRAVPLGLIVNELLANALKYAFPGDMKGRIEVALTREGGRVTLIASDDGVGLPEGLVAMEAGGMGFKIVSALASQLDGEARIERPERGSRVRVSFPEIAR